jgi:putative flippase GtrA
LKSANKFFNLRELLRFSVVGGGSVIVYTLTLVLFRTFLGLLAASVVAYVCAMTINYSLQKLWAFQSDRPHTQALPRYVVIHAGGIVLNVLTLALLADTLALWLPLSQVIAFGLVATWSYFLQKFWVFSSAKELEKVTDE